MGRARIDSASVARAVARLGDALAADPERLAPLAFLLDDFPEGYDPDQTPEERYA